MKTPQQVWDEVGQDPAWIDEPSEVLERVMREAFAGGVAAGVRIATDAMRAHAERLADSALRLPEAVPRGIVARCETLEVVATERPALERAWCDATLQPRGRRG